MFSISTKSILTLIVCCSWIVVNSQPATFHWADQLGDTNYAIYTASKCGLNSIYNAGNFGSTVDFDPHNNVSNLYSPSLSMFIQKIDLDGNFLWAKQINVTNYGTVTDLSIDHDENIFLTGYFSDSVDFDPGIDSFKLYAGSNPTIFIEKLDSNGHFIWAKHIGGTTMSMALSIDVDLHGNVLTTGFYDGTVDFDPGPSTFNLSPGGAFIEKLNNHGDFIWAKKMSPSGDFNEGHAIKCDKFGNVYTTGVFHGTTDFDPGSGTYNLQTVGGGGDIYIQKLDSNGLFIWAKGFGNPADDEGHSIAVDSNQMVYVTGYINSGGWLDCDPGSAVNLVNVWGWKSAFVQKLDSNGNFMWFKLLQSPIPGGASYECAGEKVTVDKNNAIYCAGTFNFDVDFESDSSSSAVMTSNSLKDIFVLKFSDSGILKWMNKLGGSNDDNIYAFTCDKNSNLILSGSFDSQIQFGVIPDLPDFHAIGGAAGYVTSISQIPLSVNQQNEFENSLVYPNPSRDYIIIKNSGAGEIVMKNMVGQIVLIQKASTNEVLIDVSKLPVGLYTVQIRNVIKKILIQ